MAIAPIHDFPLLAEGVEFHLIHGWDFKIGIYKLLEMANTTVHIPLVDTDADKNRIWEGDGGSSAGINES